MSEQQYARVTSAMETLKTFPDAVKDQLVTFGVMYDLARRHILAETQAHAQEKEEQRNVDSTSQALYNRE